MSLPIQALVRQAALELLNSDSDDDFDLVKQPAAKRACTPRPNYWNSPWGKMIKDGSWRDKTTKRGREFRQRFRCPPEVVHQLVVRLEEQGFSTAESYNGRRLPPLILKVLGALKVLGRAVCFDDVEEGNWISEDVNRVFFHQFCHTVGVKVWDDQLFFPWTEEDVARCCESFEAIGFPGCAFSTDCTHVKWGQCPWALKVVHTGKEGFPSLSYSVHSSLSQMVETDCVCKGILYPQSRSIALHVRIPWNAKRQDY